MRKTQKQHADPQRVGRQTTCVRFLRPIYQEIKEKSIVTGKSQSLVIHELVEAGLKRTTKAA